MYKSPTWVIGENVPGLLSSNGGRDFLTIIASLVQLGYGCTWAVLDSQYFGVAQRRRRLFIVGHSGGEPRPEILALSEGLFGHPAPSREAGEEVAGSIGGHAKGEGGFRQDLDNHGAYPLEEVAHSVPTKWRSAPEESRDTLVPTLVSEGDAHSGFRDEHGIVAHTLRSNIRNNSNPATDATMHIWEGATPRRLTPTECERLQGFPDDYTLIKVKGKDAADGPRYKALGNSMAVPVMAWIGVRIKDVIKALKLAA